MRDCWETQPELRPSFSELVTRLSSHLDAMAGYLDFSMSAGDFSVIPERVVDPFESDAAESAMVAGETEDATDSSVPGIIGSSKEATEDAIDTTVAVGSFKTACSESSAGGEDCSVVPKSAADAGAITKTD